MKRFFTPCNISFFVAWVIYIVVIWPYIRHCFIMEQAIAGATLLVAAPILAFMGTSRLHALEMRFYRKALAFMCAVSLTSRQLVAEAMEQDYNALNQNA